MRGDAQIPQLPTSPDARMGEPDTSVPGCVRIQPRPLFPSGEPRVYSRGYLQIRLTSFPSVHPHEPRTSVRGMYFYHFTFPLFTLGQPRPVSPQTPPRYNAPFFSGGRRVADISKFIPAFLHLFRRQPPFLNPRLSDPRFPTCLLNPPSSGFPRPCSPRPRPRSASAQPLPPA